MLSYVQLCNLVVGSPPGSSIHGTLQTRIPEWGAISSSRVGSQPRDRTHISCVSCIGRQILHHSATWEGPLSLQSSLIRSQVPDLLLNTDILDYPNLYILSVNLILNALGLCISESSFIYSEFRLEFYEKRFSKTVLFASSYFLCGLFLCKRVRHDLGTNQQQAKIVHQSPKLLRPLMLRRKQPHFPRIEGYSSPDSLK